VFSPDPVVNEVLAKCAADIGTHCQIFHPERFSRPFSERHKEAFEAINDWSVQNLLILAHRGWGKTSLCNFGIPSQAITFEKAKFLVLTSATSSLATMQSDNLRDEMIKNPEIRAICGDMESDQFSREMWTTQSGITVLPRGDGQQIRGLLKGNNRPDLIIVDDLEQPIAVQSPEQRQKTKNWFFSDLSNCVDRSKGGWRIIVIGTVLHEGCLLEDLRYDSAWTVIDVPLCDDGYKSYWPAFMDDEKVKELADYHRDKGLLDLFYREYKNQCIATETALFQSKYFKYYDEKDRDLNNTAGVVNVVLIDPGRTEGDDNSNAAFTAIVGVAIDSVQNAFYVRDIVNARITNDVMYKEAVSMAKRLNAAAIGIEVTGLKEYIQKPFMDYLLKSGMFIHVEWLEARGGAARDAGKNGRIGALSPYYRMGAVYHNRACCEVLEAQLLPHPKSKFKDVADAFAYVVGMSEKGLQYFTIDPIDPAEDDPEAEYRELEKTYEDPVDMDFVTVGGYFNGI